MRMRRKKNLIPRVEARAEWVEERGRLNTT